MEKGAVAMRHIIDAHLHIWDLSRFSLPWLDEVEQLDRSFTPEDYLREAGQGRDWMIDQAVYVEVDAAPEQKQAEAEYVAGICADKASFINAAVISADLSSPEAATALRPYRDHPHIRGVRHVLHVDSSPKGACLETAFVQNVRLLGELGMLFEGCLRCAELGDFTELARRCPETQMALDHMGNVDPAVIAEKRPDARRAACADQWKRDIDDLGGLSNVCVKISGLNARGDQAADILAPSLKHCFAAFGEDRIMFASNYPVCLLSSGAGPWVEALLAAVADRPEAFVDKLFRLNAAKMYQLQHTIPTRSLS